MDQNPVVHYCVKCLAPNALGNELCVRCGTRLMLVVESAASRYEDNGLSGTHVEHLLERVSALESRLARLTDRIQPDSQASSDSVGVGISDQQRSFEALLQLLQDQGIITTKQLDDVRGTICAQSEGRKE